MIWIAAILGVVLLGAALLIVGLRGRRIDNHPHCRRCSFDLVGLLPAGGTSFGIICPECGRTVASSLDMRVGTRVRRHGFIASGAAILTLALVVIGTVVWFVAKGASVYAKLPTVMLRTLIPYRSGGELDAIGAELSARIAGGKLDAREVGRVVNAALLRQSDMNHPWSSSLGGAIEAAIKAGQASDTQIDRFCAGAIRLHDSVREKIISGDEVPIRLVVENRGGMGGVLRMQAHLLDVVLDDARIDGERNSAGGPIGSPWSPSAGAPMLDYVLGPIDRSVMDEATAQYQPARARVEPGTHTVKTVWVLIVGVDTSVNPTRGVGWSATYVTPPTGQPPERTIESIRQTAIVKFMSKDHMPTWTGFWGEEDAAPPAAPPPHLHIELIRSQHTVTVVAKTVEPVELVKDEGAIAAAQGAITGTTWVQPAQPPWQPKPRLNLSLTSKSTATIAGNVYWIVNGEKKLLGSTVMHPWTATRASGASFLLPDEPAMPETVELVIEPDPAAAHRTTDCYRIVGGDVHVRIPVDEQTQAQMRGETK